MVTPAPTSGLRVPELDPLAAAEATLAVCQLVLRGIAAEDYHRATVCTEFDVAQVADHLIGSVMFFGTAAGADVGPAGGRPWRPGSPR